MSETRCWNCGAALGAEHFCPGCHKLQPLRPDEDYFSFLGYPGRQLSLDPAELEQKFYGLSRQFHPDYFLQGGDYEKDLSLEKSSLLNDAYRTLKDPVRRAEYIIRLEGAELGKAQAPPDLLMEMFELNEQLEELRAARRGGGGEVTPLKEQLRGTLAGLEERRQELLTTLQGLFEAWDAAREEAGFAGQKRALLEQMSDVLSQHSYVRNLVRDLQEEL